MSIETLKNTADGMVVGAALVGWHISWPDIAAMAAFVYTVSRLIIEAPRLIAAVKAWFK